MPRAGVRPCPGRAWPPARAASCALLAAGRRRVCAARRLTEPPAESASTPPSDPIDNCSLSCRAVSLVPFTSCPDSNSAAFCKTAARHGHQEAHTEATLPSDPDLLFLGPVSVVSSLRLCHLVPRCRHLQLLPRWNQTSCHPWVLHARRDSRRATWGVVCVCGVFLTLCC
nr:uncharacterized protein LOC111774157 isoform X2 [Equus caballus]